MKIILVTTSLANRAGIERMTIELANLLDSVYEVSIIVINKFNPRELPFKVNKKIKIISLECNFRWFNIDAIRKLRFLMKEMKPDIIISVAVQLVSITAPAVLGLGIKNISWEHFNLNAGSKLGFIWRIVATWFVSRTVVLTHADAKDYHSNLASKITTIYNFTTIGHQNLTSKCSERIMIAVGRHEQQKGFDLLIRAWAKAETRDWKLRIIGSGSKLDENLRLAKTLNTEGSIDFLPNTSSIEQEFLNASCFILSSRYEGLVMVLIEAKMMGLPSICFDCPNSPREVIQNGIDGWLVTSENIDELSNKISFVIKNSESLKYLGNAAKIDAINRFGKDKAIKEWSELFYRLLKK